MIALSTNQKTNKAFQDFKKPGAECGTKCDLVSKLTQSQIIIFGINNYEDNIP